MWFCRQHTPYATYAPFLRARQGKIPGTSLACGGGGMGSIARRLGGAGSRGEWEGVQSLPQLCQPVPDVTVFGEMRTGAMVCGCCDQLIYRITPFELRIKSLAELAWFTRWWVDLVWNAGSMQIHTLEFPRLGSDEMVRIRRESRSIKAWIEG